MIRILIVEDEQAISRLIQISLRNVGYACDCAFDGKAAVQYLESTSYDLILLDIMLPEIDGFELMEYIRPYKVHRDLSDGQKFRKRPGQGVASGGR